MAWHKYNMNLVRDKIIEKNQGELHLELDCVVKVRFVVAKRRCSERSICGSVCVCGVCAHACVHMHMY